jgi:hypothetical protein
MKAITGVFIFAIKLSSSYSFLKKFGAVGRVAGSFAALMIAGERETMMLDVSEFVEMSVKKETDQQRLRQRRMHVPRL